MPKYPALTGGAKEGFSYKENPVRTKSPPYPGPPRKNRNLRVNDPYYGDEKNRGKMTALQLQNKLSDNKLQEYQRLQIKRKSTLLEISWWNRWQYFWNLEVVERIYFDLRDNPVHPFEDLGNGFYKILLRKDRYHFGVCMLIATLTIFINFSVFLGVFTMTVLTFMMCMGVGFYFLYGHMTQKELIISRSAGYVIRTTRRKTVYYEEPINNVYLKLIRRTDSNQKYNYFLCIGGYRLDDIRLTPFTMDLEPLRLMSKAMAVRMGLNYFDLTHHSPLHKIYHYPAQGCTLKVRSSELEKFLKSHNLTRQAIEKAQEAEGLPQKTPQVPKALLQKIMMNYGQDPDVADDRGRPGSPRRNWGEKKRRSWDNWKRWPDTLARPGLSGVLETEYASRTKHHEVLQDLYRRYDDEEIRQAEIRKAKYEAEDREMEKQKVKEEKEKRETHRSDMKKNKALEEQQKQEKEQKRLEEIRKNAPEERPPYRKWIRKPKKIWGHLNQQEPPPSTVFRKHPKPPASDNDSFDELF